MNYFPRKFVPILFLSFGILFCIIFPTGIMTTDPEFSRRVPKN